MSGETNEQNQSKKERKTKNTLTKREDFGSALITAAEQKLYKRKEDLMIEHVTAELALIEETEKAIRIATQQKEYYEKVVALIRTGNFEINLQGVITLPGKMKLGRYQPPESVQVNHINTRDDEA